MRSVTKEIVIYLLLVFLFSSLPYAILIHSGHLATGGGLLVFLLMWCPAAAAFLTCALRRIPVSSLGWNWFPARYESYGYFLPIVYALPVYVITWAVVGGSFALQPFLAAAAKSFQLADHPYLAAFGLEVPLLATIGVISSLARALGEEIGWRGFLLPRLVQKLGFGFGCLLSGCIWASWHYPLLLGADYNAGTTPAYALICFTLMVIAMAFVMGWLRLKSGSLWPCALLHASHNLFVQAIFDGMTAHTGRAPYITTEFGFGLVLSIGAVALYFASRHKELPTESLGDNYLPYRASAAVAGRAG